MAFTLYDRTVAAMKATKRMFTRLFSLQANLRLTAIVMLHRIP